MQVASKGTRHWQLPFMARSILLQQLAASYYGFTCHDQSVYTTPRIVGRLFRCMFKAWQKPISAALLCVHGAQHADSSDTAAVGHSFALWLVGRLSDHGDMALSSYNYSSCPSFLVVYSDCTPAQSLRNHSWHGDHP